MLLEHNNPSGLKVPKAEFGSVASVAPAPIDLRRRDEAVYIESPVLSSLTQIRSFFESGMFSLNETPVFIRGSKFVKLQAALRFARPKVPFSLVEPRRVNSLPVPDGTVVFYPFNSQSNMTAVDNRKLRHVLTLHGESNKFASNRPAARIYDYVCIAGPKARDRYVRAGIFTPHAADAGRLIMMGDSFVQSINWIRAAKPSEDGMLFYSPTWEGYGNGADNYSSVAGIRGFEIAIRAARAAGINRVVVKSHPYLGLLRPSLLGDFVRGVKAIKAAGLDVSISTSEANLPLRFLAKLRLSDAAVAIENSENPIPIRLALCDVSGMEAIFLKQGIPHLTITRTEDIPLGLEEIFALKGIQHADDVDKKVQRYLDESRGIDSTHSSHVFGWQSDELRNMTGGQRRKWLIDYVREDPYWSSAMASQS